MSVIPRIREAIRRTLNKRMQSPFCPRFGRDCGQTGCSSIRNNVQEVKKRSGYAPPLSHRRPAHKRLIVGGSGWIDRADANRSGGGVQNSSHLHALVKESLRLLLVVELIGGLAVSGRKDKFVPGFCDRSVKRRLLRRRANRVLIVRRHRLVLSCGLGRRTGRTLRERRLTCETQSNS